MMNVVEMFNGHIAKNQYEDRFDRMVPIGTLTYEEGWDNILALVMDENEDLERYVELEYCESAGLSAVDPVHSTFGFVQILQKLCERTDE